MLVSSELKSWTLQFRPCANKTHDGKKHFDFARLQCNRTGHNVCANVTYNVNWHVQGASYSLIADGRGAVVSMRACCCAEQTEMRSIQMAVVNSCLNVCREMQ